MEAATQLVQNGINHVLITGATGFIGSELVSLLSKHALKISVISARPQLAKRRLGAQVSVYGNTSELANDANIDAIVHLAGANVMAWPWTARRKALLHSSRLALAEQLLAYCARIEHRPKVWVQASAVGFYPTEQSQVWDEQAKAGAHFAGTLCTAIEQTAHRAQALGLRVANLRLGLVLGKSGGVFPMMSLGTKLSGAAVLGTGQQRVAWVHINDVLAMISTAMQQEHWQGAINAIAPTCPRYTEFAKALAKATHRPCWLKVPAFALRLALGERAMLLLEGAELSTAKLQALGFKHQFGQLDLALRDLVR